VGALVVVVTSAVCVQALRQPQPVVTPSHPRANAPPLSVTLDVPRYHQSRSDDYLLATTRAVDLLGEWLGPIPYERLVVKAVPWATGPYLAPRADPSTLIVPHHWFSLRGDRSLDRFIIAGLARTYWLDLVEFDADEQWFASGLVRFTAARAVYEMIDGDHFSTALLFGESFAYPVRRAPLSMDRADPRPYRRRIHEAAVLLGDDPARERRGERASRALQTLERYVGWPVLSRSLAVFADRFRGRVASVTDFEQVCQEVTGRDLRWFFTSAFREDAHFDYGIGEVASHTSGDNRYQTTVTVRRFGDTAFTGSTQSPVPGFESGAAIEVQFTFADGTELHEFWDGRAAAREFVFSSRAALVDAVVDPDAVILLDDDWANNRWTAGAPIRSTSTALALLWTAWLQHYMMTLTSAL
jgi:hypothetical protein